MTTPQLSDYLGLSPHTLQRYRCNGGGPKFKKIGNKIFYAESDVMAWIEASSRDSTSDSEDETQAPEGQTCTKRYDSRRGVWVTSGDSA